MAALLKKRALAEYTQSQTIVNEPVEQPKPKRLRIVKKSQKDSKASVTSLEAEVNNLDSNKTTGENFRILSRIACLLPSTIAPIESSIQKKIISLFHSDKNSALKAKCLTILQLLSLNHGHALATIDEVMRLISHETSHLVILNGLSVALKLAKATNEPVVNQRILNFAKKLLSTTDVKVKCRCIEIISTLTPLEDPIYAKENLQLVHLYSGSNDPRIRSTSFKAMLVLHEKGVELDISMYGTIAKYLDDDYESVKLASTQLLWALSESYPDELIPAPSGGGDLRLIDDAFAKICHVINDPCVQVRVLAAQLLGKMQQVSQTFLDQTLDKKLMSDMRRKRSAHELQWEKVKAGEWSSGKKWADDAPKEVIDADSVSLITSGAAGAFVHGLEDEFMEVRSAAVDSLCALALRNSDFANLALDFLVDMFNDEIEEVRLKAIDSLTKISKHISLWEDQLEIILSALEDSSIDIREGLHKLLAVCHLMTKDCVKMCLDKLLANLKKYTHDKKSIWRSLEGLGKNHPWVLLPLVPQFLSQHPFFDTTETDPEDPAYITVLILVFNAAKGCHTMTNLFDDKLMKHYYYLRDTLPSLVPDLTFSQETPNAMKGNDGNLSLLKLSSTNGRILLKELIGKLKNSQNLSSVMQMRLSKLILKDLKRLAEIDPEVSAIAKFTSLYIRAQLVYTNCMGGASWTQMTQNTHNEALRQQVQKFLQLCLKMQYAFTGLSPTEYAIILQLKLRALLFQLVYIVKGSNASALAICQNLLEQAEKVQKYLEANGNIQPDEFTMGVFKILDSLDDPKPGTVAKLVLPLFELNPISFVSFSSSVRLSSATIIDPTGESDTPLKFTAGLLLGIRFDCEIRNLTDITYVRIRVSYPDQQVHLICPRLSDFRVISPTETRLLTIVNVSHQAWTEACSISLGVVLDLSGPETNYNRKLIGKNDSAYTIELSEEKQVLVAPKPPKKGI